MVGAYIIERRAGKPQQACSHLVVVRDGKLRQHDVLGGEKLDG
jgi:hypothetical protein